MKITNNITIENARIIFRNFSGKETDFNAQGKRNFCVLLNEDMAKNLSNDGWNIKYTNAKTPDDIPNPFLNVTVSYNVSAPKIVMITNKGQIELNEDNIDELDRVAIKNADLIIKPYNWEVNKKTGVKAYLKTMYITIEEDELEKKYSMNSDNTMKSGEWTF